jgi:hypothetical protein
MESISTMVGSNNSKRKHPLTIYTPPHNINDNINRTQNRTTKFKIGTLNISVLGDKTEELIDLLEKKEN